METISETSDKPEDKKTRKEINLTYQGRRTARAGSEQRRRQILEAALRIVVRDGVRGVRHRAVAAEAEVPLSATTYYFKDISDLITDTFTLFVDRGVAKYRDLIETSQAPLLAALVRLRAEPSSRDEIVFEIVQVLVTYLRRQLSEHRDYLLAEQAFRLECLRNDKLRAIAEQHTELLLQDLYQFFALTGSDEPKTDGILMMQIISAAEYHGLLQPVGSFDEQWSKTLLTRGIHHMLNALTNTPSG